MMNSLMGLLNVSQIQMIKDCVKLRFKEPDKFKTPEALIIHEHKLLDEDTLLKCMNKEYGPELHIPAPTYIPGYLLDHFASYDCVPLQKNSITDTIHVGVLPELDRKDIPAYNNMKIQKHYIPIHYFVEQYTKIYGSPDFLHPLPIKDTFGFILEEALSLQASEITISSGRAGAKIYYSVKKKRVDAYRPITYTDVAKIATFLMNKANEVLTTDVKRLKCLTVQLDFHHRGRVIINETYDGQIITIKIIQKNYQPIAIEELHMDTETTQFLRQHLLSREKGLRLVVGPKDSGKSTTIMAILNELLEKDCYKIISVENPVESLMDNMEQINMEREEDFLEVADSLILQNPDTIYISQMTGKTARVVFGMANIGQVVFSSLHASGIPECMVRLQELTGYDMDKIIISLHSIVFQQLYTTVDGKLKPKTKFIHFSQKMKSKLIGKTIGEVYLMLKEEEEK